MSHTGRSAEAPSSPRRTIRLPLACAVVLALLVCFAPSASAAYYTHPFLFEFGPDGTPDTAFGHIASIAVDQASHDVYVADAGEDRVYRFDSTGARHDFTEGEAAGRNWVSFSLSGFYSRPAINGIAVAPSGAPGGTAGDLYVSWSAHQTAKETEPERRGGVEIYSPGGAHLGTLDGSGNPHHHPTESAGAYPCGVATDPGGNVYVSFSYCGTEVDGSEVTHIDKYVPSANPVANGDFDSEIETAESPGRNGGTIAAATSGLYFTVAPSSVDHLTKFPYSLFPGGGGSADASGAGTELSIGGRPGALTIDRSSEYLYLGASRFFPLAGGPNTRFGALQVDEAGEAVSLLETPNEVYGVGLDESSGRAYVSVGGVGGVNKVFAYGPGTVVNPPTATIDPPSSVTYKSAHLSGTVNPGGSGEAETTYYRFECQPSCPGLEIVNREVPADGADHEVSDDAERLEPETTYEVKLIAANDLGLQQVEDVTSFETLPAPPVTAPAVTIDPVGGVGAESAHLSGTVDPMGEGEGQGTTYRFEYSAGGVKWTALPDQGPIEGTSGPQAVSAELEGLTPNTSYSVRLHAENDGGEATSVAPNPSFTTEAAPPRVEASPATEVLSGAARLNGHVNPRGSQTAYYFQWGTADCASSSCASIPASEDAEAGSGPDFLAVHARLTGLAPQTTYHYRLLARSPAGEASSADATFTTGAAPAPCGNERVGLAAALPDCRAYEMVSPLEKAGGNVASETWRTRAAADGDAVTFVSQAAFAGTEGYPYSGAEYLSSRGAGGWSTHSITPTKKSPPAPNALIGSQYVGSLSPDLERGVYQALAPNPDATPNTEGVDDLFLANGMRGGAPTFTLLSDSAKPLGDQPPSQGEANIAFVDASADFSHVAFESRKNLTAGASGTREKLYEWADGAVRLAGILPDSACGSPPCAASESVGGAGAKGHGRFGRGTYTQLAHPVSEDGSKVFFTAGSLKPATGDIGLEGSLYVREDGAHTTQIDASERTEPDPKGGGRSEFQWASPNGEEVLFLSKEELVNEDTDGERTSLYRWRADAPAGGRLTLVATPGMTPAHVIDATADGAFVYLLGSVLGRGKNIYVLHGDTLRQVAGLTGDDAAGERGIEADQPRMTPDGRHLLFHSYGKLTGYDNHSSACGVPSAHYEECRELYLYSYDADEVSCPSCDPSGTPATADVPGFLGPTADAGLSGAYTPYLPTFISEDGRYVFFTSPDALVPGDIDGRYDAYVYDTARREPRLLSSGQCNCDSIFLTASPSGHDAFFTTRQQLVRMDTDNLADLYDARVGGGIAAQNALPPAECQGDACQPPPAPPSLLATSSSLFAGAGNLAPRRDCSATARRLRRLSRAARSGRHRARRLRNRATHGARGPRTRLLLRRSRRLTALSRRHARRARRLAGQAKRCRRANRRAGR